VDSRGSRPCASSPSGGAARGRVPRLLILPLLALATDRAAAQIGAFTEEAVARGLVYAMPPVLNGFTIYGIGLADLDADGDLEVVATGTPSGVLGIFENDGAGHFTDRSASSGIPAFTDMLNFGAVDLDGDDDLDLIVLRVAMPPMIFRNDGGLQFTDISAKTGIDKGVLPTGMAAGDVDGDGRVDLFIPHFRYNWPPGMESFRHTLWRNNGDGTFTDIAPQLGLDLHALTYAVALFDADDDADLDLYVSNDRGHMASAMPNRFFRNDDGAFTEIGQQNGTGLGFFSMGIGVGDIDGDDVTDLYCTNAPFNVAPIYGANPLLQGSASGMYSQTQVPWGVDHHIYSWACFFFDANNDGLQDLFVVNQDQPDTLYLNTGAPPMINATAASGLGVPGGRAYGGAYGDVDGDGDLDIVTYRYASNIRLFINPTNESANWIKLSVLGEGEDSIALGATVTLAANGAVQRSNVLQGGNGFLGQSTFDAHFGLGADTVAAALVIRWPNSGSVRTLLNYPANTRWTVYPPELMGDYDGDSIVTQFDLSRLSIECGGPVAPGLEMLDMNGDAWLDSLDFALISGAMTGLVGDFNADGVVDGNDLGTLLGDWMAPCTASDLTGDGVVDGDDLGTLLGNWS